MTHRFFTTGASVVVLAGVAFVACSSADTSLFGNAASTGDDSTIDTGPGAQASSGAQTSSGAGGHGTGGAGGQGGTGGCKTAVDCADAFACTVDTCVGDKCVHEVGPPTGPT